MKMFSMESFSDWLLKELKSRDMSQSDLSRLAKIGTGTISNIMSGNRKVGQDTLLAIAHALRLPPDTVFRAAGLLPPKSKADEKIEQINHLAESMSEDEKQELLEYIRFRIKIAEEKKDKETEHANRNKRRPASAEGHG